jgi:hypothetical protein
MLTPEKRQRRRRWKQPESALMPCGCIQDRGVWGRSRGSGGRRGGRSRGSRNRSAYALLPLIIITATLRAGACEVAILAAVHAQIIGLSVASLLLGERTPSARGDVHGTRVGPYGSRVAARVGVGSGGDPSDTTARVLAILLSLSPRIVEADAERDILVERVWEVPSDQKVFNLRSETTAEGGNL